MQQDYGEKQGFPSPTALTFSYNTTFAGLIARSSATCRPLEIQVHAESPEDIYEWEFSGETP